MKTLNETATNIFLALLRKMDGKQYLKIENELFMPLSIKKIQDDVNTDLREAILYSLSHNYEQNGFLIHDPEMTFIVIENRKSDINGFELPRIIPATYRQDNLGIYQKSITLYSETAKRYHPKLQEEHTEFANIWLSNIKDQGFI